MYLNYNEFFTKIVEMKCRLTRKFQPPALLSLKNWQRANEYVKLFSLFTIQNMVFVCELECDIHQTELAHSNGCHCAYTRYSVWKRDNWHDESDMRPEPLKW